MPRTIIPINRKIPSPKFDVDRPGSGPIGFGSGDPWHDFPMQVMELPGSARELSANPSKSFSVSKTPKKAVKKALPSTIEFSLFASSPT